MGLTLCLKIFELWWYIREDFKKFQTNCKDVPIFQKSFENAIITDTIYLTIIDKEKDLAAINYFEPTGINQQIKKYFFFFFAYLKKILSDFRCMKRDEEGF